MIGDVAYNANNFSPLLPTTWISKYSNFTSCVFFCIVAYNADNFAALSTTARKNDRRCCLHSRKIIGVVAKNAEKCSNLKPYANLHKGQSGA
jgi:hypothetical protein